MAGKADIETQLNSRRHTIDAVFFDWRDLHLDSEARRSLLERYFKEAELGEPSLVGESSLLVSPTQLDPDHRHVLVVGRHDLHDLRPRADAAVADTTLVGAGTASRLGPMVAFAEGAQAARTLLDAPAVNLSFLSLGDDERVSSLDVGQLVGAESPSFDAIFVTDAVAWTPHHPTLTVGSRGEVVVQLSLRAGQPISDFVTSGAVRNPLTSMAQVLGGLRGSDGRIAIPGFYERASAPAADVRASLSTPEYDPNAWTEHLGRSQPSGKLSALERATLWPGVSVLAVQTDVRDGHTAPGSVVATVAFYLVPDQRPAEIEAHIRSWFESVAPEDSAPRVKVVRAARPYRADAGSAVLRAQSRAALRVTGRQPVLVPGGGAIGAGELSYAADAPVAFAGIARPSPELHTLDERLPRLDFENGVALAAQTCLELRRP